MALFCLFASIATLLTFSSEVSSASLLVSSCEMKLLADCRSCLTSVSLPSRVLLSSWTTVLVFSRPPPLNRSEAAPSTSSSSGLRPERDNGILSPDLSVPIPPDGGAPSDTNFSPRRLVWRIVAIALAGNLASRLILRSMTAVQPLSLMLVTLPTVTSLTLTALCGTRSRTSRNST